MPRRRAVRRALRPLALALALLGAACGRGGEAPPAEALVTVEAVQIEPALLRDVATFSGQLSAENSVEVKSETSGIVAEIPFAEGQAVRGGDEIGRASCRERV